MSRIRTEHAGIMRVGGWWGSRTEAKAMSRRARRRNGRSMIESELEDIAMCGRADDPSTHEDAIPEDPYLRELALTLEAQGARLRAERLEAILRADRDDPSIDYPSEV